MKMRAQRAVEQPLLDDELRDLLERAMGGDARSYEAFLRKVGDMIRAYLMKSVKPSRTRPEQVEDLVQDVLLAVHNKQDTYRKGLPIRPWLYAIARYRLIDSYRASGREPLVHFAEESSFDEIADDRESDFGTSRMDVETLMADLPEKQKQVLMLAKIEEVPLVEIAERMGMSLSAVKVSIHRAMCALRTSYGNSPEGEDEDR